MHGYAEIKGHQFRIVPGEEIKVPSLDVEEGSQYDISNILMYDDGKMQLFGEDCKKYVAKATVLSHGREAKIIVFKKKRRKDYKVKNGHRQGFTSLMINDIVMLKEN